MLLFIDIDSYKDVDRLTFLLAEVDTARQFAEGIVQNAPWPLLILDRELRVIKANPAFYAVFQTSPEETERQLIYALGNGPWNIPGLRRLLDDIIPHNSRFQDFAVTHEFPHVGEKTLLLNARRIRRDEQETDTILLGLEDITEHRQTEKRIVAALREKEVLLREIYHRVKNNLQIISSLLGLQADTIADEAVRGLFEESQRRIQAMSLVHERLHGSEDLSSIDTRTYLQNLIGELARMYDPEGRIAFDIQAESYMNIDTAVPCGLMLTELVSNAFKYAFPEAQPGRIRVTLQPEAENHWLLVVQDNGLGLPSDIDITDTNSLGLTLVHDLASQLEGSVQVDRSQGTTFTIHFLSAQTAGA
jgi:chemotaxis protein methyltransferase CheR